MHDDFNVAAELVGPLFPVDGAGLDVPVAAELVVDLVSQFQNGLALHLGWVGGQNWHDIDMTQNFSGIVLFRYQVNR